MRWNYIDRELRKDMAEHTRETVRQGREGNAAMQRLLVELGTVKRWMSDIWFERYENPPLHMLC